MGHVARAGGAAPAACWRFRRSARRRSGSDDARVPAAAAEVAAAAAAAASRPCDEHRVRVVAVRSAATRAAVRARARRARLALPVHNLVGLVPGDAAPDVPAGAGFRRAAASGAHRRPVGTAALADVDPPPETFTIVGRWTDPSALPAALELPQAGPSESPVPPPPPDPAATTRRDRIAGVLRMSVAPPPDHGDVAASGRGSVGRARGATSAEGRAAALMCVAADVHVELRPGNHAQIPGQGRRHRKSCCSSSQRRPQRRRRAPLRLPEPCSSLVCPCSRTSRGRREAARFVVPAPGAALGKDEAARTAIANTNVVHGKLRPRTSALRTSHFIEPSSDDYGKSTLRPAGPRPS